VYFDRVRFDEVAADFLTDYRLNQKKSLKKAEQVTEHLKSYFRGYRIPQITTPKIQSYVEYRLTKGATNATINRELAALKRMLNLAAQQTPPKIDRVPHIPMLKENNIRKGFFEHGDFLALRDALPFHLKGFVTFAYKTGWRVSEIKNLKWSQVDLDQGIVRIEGDHTKNNEARSVYLDTELREVFHEQWERKKAEARLTPYVFDGANGRDMVKDFRRAWRKACKDAKLGKRLFHDFRRTAVRNMIRAGIPERVAMMVSGQKTRSVFERYNIVSDTDLKMAAQRQAEYLNAQMVTKTVTIENLETRKSSMRL
jgi:integrase